MLETLAYELTHHEQLSHGELFEFIRELYRHIDDLDFAYDIYYYFKEIIEDYEKKRPKLVCRTTTGFIGRSGKNNKERWNYSLLYLFSFL